MHFKMRYANENNVKMDNWVLYILEESKRESGIKMHDVAL